MSQRDGFSGGFLLGTIVGGIVGGVVGALLTAKQFTNDTDSAADQPATKASLGSKSNRKKRSLHAGRNELEIETARRSLEDKIAQLNDAIDDVRQQLGGVNGAPIEETSPRSMPPDNRP
jgi:hypothetical protein